MAAKAFAKNSYFYLLTTSSTSNFNWHTILTLYDSSQFIMNQIRFNDLGQAIEDFNLNGYNIVGLSFQYHGNLSWKLRTVIKMEEIATIMESFQK